MAKKKEYVVFSADTINMIVIGVCSTKDKAIILQKLGRYVVPNATPEFMDKENFIDNFMLSIGCDDDDDDYDDFRVDLWGVPDREELNSIKTDEAFMSAVNALESIVNRETI
jgi:hypothetical protein